ncbi:MAG: TetR family transcriptional regulator [Actinomycetota bacterium]|nr:TetR family transcriptional regulator [Actinomycetota bacterium]
MTEEEASPRGLRERHRRRTAAQLEEVALRLFVERGFDATTVDDIAAAAEVSRRTFFRYFASKEDVLLSDHPRRLAELRAALAARPPSEPILTALRQALMSMTGTYEEDRERLLRRATLMRATPSLQARSLMLQRDWEQAVSEMVAEHLGVDAHGDLRAVVVAAAIMGATRAAFGVWLEGGGQAHLPSLVAEALDLLDSGLLQMTANAPKPSRRAAVSSRN